jgi:hypothetical protein
MRSHKAKRRAAPAAASAAKAIKQDQPAARKKRPTADQRRARADMRTLSAAWNNLMEAQRQAWDDEAHTNRRGGYTPRSRRRSGRRMFMKANFRRLALSQEILTDPPGEDSYRPAPSVSFFITNSGGRIALELGVPSGQAEGLMVSSWHPLNPGVMVWKKFVRICRLPAPVEGKCDITKRYVAKYGVPPAGKKVFIRVQQMNDYVGSIVQIVSAIVPAGLGGGGHAKEA